jgi:acylphosphatase
VGEEVIRRLRIRGHVQGVGFRWHLLELARELRLKGWVRNRQDGSVEALICGSHEEVVAVIHWAGKGPASARVAGVEVEEGAGEDSIPENFVQAATI